MKNVWFAIKWAILVVICIFLAINLWNLFARNVLKQEWPTMFGLSSATIRDDCVSMEPTYYGGDFLIYCTASEYNVGDIIVFKDSYSDYTTHRIVGINDDGTYKTKGDNPENSIDQNPVAKEDIQGKVIIAMQGFGYVVTFLHQPLGLIIIFLVGACLIILPTALSNKQEVKDGKEE